MTATIDFREIAARTNLTALLESALGAPHVVGGKPRWCCPWHADSSPSLYLYDGGRRWRCWPCGLTGDALDFLVRLDGISLTEAARKLDPTLATPTPSCKPRRQAVRDRDGSQIDPSSRPPNAPQTPSQGPPSRPLPAWQDPAWQAAVDALIVQAETALWSADGAEARAWLRARGFAPDTMARHRLGFLPAPVRSAPLEVLADPRDGQPRPIVAHRGIVLPWLRPGSWYGTTPEPDGVDPRPRWVGANVRQLRPDIWEPWTERAKYLAFPGSARGHLYPYAGLTRGVPVLLAEGEPDALLGQQELGYVVNVATVGGASQRPEPEALAALRACSHWLIASDYDGAGGKAAAALAGLAPSRAVRLWLPHGKDLGEFHLAGGNLLDWLRGEFRRLGWRWPLAHHETREITYV